MVRKGRGGSSQILTHGGWEGEKRESPLLKKGTLISGLEIHCLDKCLTMNRRNKKISRELLSVN